MSRLKRNSMLFTMLLLVFCCAACHDSVTAPERVANALTLNEVYELGILRLIGQEVLLYEDIDWKWPLVAGPAVMEKFPSPLPCLPAKTQPDETVLFTPLWLDFEAATTYIDEPEFRGLVAGKMKVVSNDLFADMSIEQDVKSVSYQGKPIERGHSYYLKGSFHYKPVSIFDLPPQGDSECLQQVNQIKYWWYIFEFHVTSLSETPPQ